jgi:Zn-dependent protease with chaperone function
LTNDPQRSRQLVFLRQSIEVLSRKAKLRRTPEISISKHERLASVNIFQNRISIGEYFLSLWQEGKFDDDDVEATIAHEVGHLMDLRHDSRSSNFRNLLCESLWFSFGIVPIVIYLLFPGVTSIAVSGLLAIGWGFSLPWIVRRVEVGIELEADRNAAVYLVKPKQLADALVKISSFGMPQKNLGLTAKLSFLAGTITHPSFKERVRYLQSLTTV